MDLAKEIRRQVQGKLNMGPLPPTLTIALKGHANRIYDAASFQGSRYDFTFNVKFYPPDPAQLSEDITRYGTRPLRSDK